MKSIPHSVNIPLEHDGVIQRLTKPTTPPTVWYALTPEGHELCGSSRMWWKSRSGSSERSPPTRREPALCNNPSAPESNLQEVFALHLLFAALAAFALLQPDSASQPSSGKRRRPTIRYFIATAYSVEGTGASGKWSHPGTVAADRKILPLNSRIRIYGAGRYSGDYTVEDTGAKVDGHHIDVYMPSHAEAKKFGRQRVKVVILKYGDDEATPPDPKQKAEAKAVNRKVRAEANAAPTK